MNAQWMIDMPPMQIQVMNPHFSDHSPLSIEVEATMDNRKRPFRFYNCLADHPDFGKIVQEYWSIRRGDMWSIWQNLKCVKAALKGLNKKEFVDTTKKVQKLRGDLESIQAQMRNTASSADMFETEKDIRLQLEKWSMI